MDSFSKAISLVVAHLLDKTGFHQDTVKKRRMAYRIIAATLTKRSNLIVIGGSKGEGLTSLLESDDDLLYLLTDFLCCEKEDNPCFYQDRRWVLTMNTELCSPGYTLLMMPKRETPGTTGKGFISPMGENCIASSSQFLDIFEKHVREVDHLENPPNECDGMRAGPSIPIVRDLVGYSTSIDNVQSLPCHCPTILHEWFIRHRPHGWPSLQDRVEILRFGANLCPVGCKEDELHDQQWRLCFNLGEIKLVECMNDVQTKVYITLKMMLKQILNPENKELTSYTMKNIVFWLCEMHPQNAFSPETLMLWVRKALRMLRKSIEINRLPYYMIPARNLLKPLTADRKQMLITNISKIIADPLVVFRCKKIDVGMKLFDRGVLDAWSCKRDSYELLLLDIMATSLHPFYQANGMDGLLEAFYEQCSDRKQALLSLLHQGEVEPKVDKLL